MSDSLVPPSHTPTPRHHPARHVDGGLLLLQAQIHSSPPHDLETTTTTTTGAQLRARAQLLLLAADARLELAVALLELGEVRLGRLDRLLERLELLALLFERTGARVARGALSGRGADGARRWRGRTGGEWWVSGAVPPSRTSVDRARKSHVQRRGRRRPPGLRGERDKGISRPHRARVRATS